MANFLEIKPGVPLEEHDLILELNKLITKRKREYDNFQEFFRSTKYFKGQLEFGDHPSGRMNLNLE